MGVEIEKGYDPYEPTAEDIRCIELSREEFKQGEYVDGEVFIAQMKQKYVSNKQRPLRKSI